VTTSPGAPRTLGNAADIAGQAEAGQVRGAVWRLADDDRDLDANVIRLAPLDAIGPHDGPGLDVLILVLSGVGELATPGAEVVVLTVGELVWLPARARRHFTAGPTGLTYLTVHRRRPKLSIPGAALRRADL